MFTKLNGNGKKIIFCTFDIETYISDITRFRLADIYNGKKHYFCKNSYELIQNMLKSGHSIFYAHFAAFDSAFILQHIFGNIYEFEKLQIIMAGALPVSVKFRIRGKDFEIRDSYKLLPDKLDNLAKNLIGESKLYNLNETNIDLLTDSEVYKYCKKDTEVLYRILEKFQKIVDNQMRLTFSSTSLAVFRNKFMKFDFQEIGLKRHIMFRNHFSFAGRTEVIKTYGKDIVSVDINSSYPYVMKNFKIPYGVPINTKRLAKNNEFGFYSIMLNKLPDLYLPFLPMKYGRPSKLFFLNCNEKIYNVTDYEINKLIELGVDFKILDSYIFQSDILFDEYIDHFYKMRFENPSLKIVAKLLMNGLSGKFSQSEMCEKIGEYSEAKIMYIPEKNIGKIEEIIYNSFMNAQISASIWSAARMVLYEYAERVQSSLLYCDTDSLFIPKSELHKLEKFIDKKKLGFLKQENEFKEIYFLGQKVYAGIKQNNEIYIKFKGFEQIKNKGNFNADEFKKIEREYQEKIYQKFKEYHNSGIADFQMRYDAMKRIKTSLRTNDFLQLQEKTKFIKSFSLKRKLCRDKINTIPYKLVNNQLF